MSEFLRIFCVWLLLVYLFVGFGLALIDAPQGVYMIAMFFGVGLGFVFGKEYHASIWESKKQGAVIPVEKSGFAGWDCNARLPPKQAGEEK